MRGLREDLAAYDAGDLTAALTDHFAGDGATVVDIGASWGLFSCHLARLAGGAGAVLSYEPHPVNKPRGRWRSPCAPAPPGSPPSWIPSACKRGQWPVASGQSSIDTARVRTKHDLRDAAAGSLAAPAKEDG